MVKQHERKKTLSRKFRIANRSVTHRICLSCQVICETRETKGRDAIASDAAISYNSANWLEAALWRHKLPDSIHPWDDGTHLRVAPLSPRQTSFSKSDTFSSSDFFDLTTSFVTSRTNLMKGKNSLVARTRKSTVTAQIKIWFFLREKYLIKNERW